MTLSVMKRFFLLIVTTFIVGSGLAEAVKSNSHVGYLFPAGGRQGVTLEVTAGGRHLKGVQEVFVSGSGVKAEFVLHFPNYKKTYGDYLKQLQREQRKKAQPHKKKRKVKKAVKKKKEVTKDVIVPPNHPYFRGLEDCSPLEMTALIRRYYKENKQRARELDDIVMLKVTIAPDAKPGVREIRLRTTKGLSNPMRFFVGDKPEFFEREPNEDVLDGTPLTPPFLINGQITAGDLDRFQFVAKEGEKLLVQGHAREVIPFIADAVPGWFQATLTLYDSSGKEVAYADDYRFNPDPILFFNVPADGVYTLQIRDAIYRGREDFVYRVSVGADPFITHLFPLGGRQNRRSVASVSGWNLSVKELELDTQKPSGTTHLTGLDQSNRVPYAVDDLPEVFETASNDTMRNAQTIVLPVVVNGKIEHYRDKDVYRFQARPGDEVVAEVNARRLHSPLDSLLRLTDAEGKVIAWNDDAPRPNLGKQTHHADSMLTARIPKKGFYFIHLSNAQSQGGDEYAYRLRVSSPMPDFSLTSSPASISVGRGGSMPIFVQATRKDGFDGAIDIVLKDAPAGFFLKGARIPAGCDSVTMTITAPLNVKNENFKIRLQGRSSIDRRGVILDVTPAVAMTQAFITPHMMPTQQMMVYVRGAGESPEVILSKRNRLILNRAGETRLRIKKTKHTNDLKLKLYDAPKGFTIEERRSGNNSISVLIKLDGYVETGAAGNLIIEVYRAYKTKDGKARLQPMGVMPAVPYTVN